MQFQHINYFWFLLGLIVLIAIFFTWKKQRKNKINLLGDNVLIEKLIPSFEYLKKGWRFAFLICALFFGIFSLANLQEPEKDSTLKRSGIDVVIALDLSKSMYAQDVAPSRLEKAKLLTSKLIEKLHNNRIGLVFFAGKSYISVPLTSDLAAIKMNLDIATPNLIPTQGTVIGEAIEMASQIFNEKETQYKSIILISDGEDHDEKAASATKDAVDKGIKINTIGVGSVEGGKIPLPNTNQQFVNDENGNVVVSKLNEEELIKIAELGNGIYEPLQNIDNVTNAIFAEINSMKQKQLGGDQYMNYKTYFQYFLILSLFFILLEFFIHIQISKKKMSVLMLILFCNLNSFAQQKNSELYLGNKNYKEQKFSEAETYYNKIIEINPKNRNAQFNLANAQYQNKQYEKAMKNFEEVATVSSDKNLKANAWHNAGNTYADQQKWAESINYYKQALRNNPNSKESKYALAYAQQMLKKEQQNKENKKDDKKEKEQQKDKDNKEKEQKEKEQQNKDKQDEEKKKQDEKKNENKSEEQQPKKMPSKLTKEQAKQILDALNREEQKLKGKKEKGKAGNFQLEKDW